MVDLKDCLTVKSAEEKTGKAHSFEVATPSETFYMYAGACVTTAVAVAVAAFCRLGCLQLLGWVVAC